MTRTAVQCLHRWTKILKPGLTKGPWTKTEDKKLIEWVKLEGPTKWSQCAIYISGRSGKQCRERWNNTLSPQVKKGDWSIEEDYTIFKLYSIYGTKWSKIALSFPGRTENSIKNRFYSTLRRIDAETRKASIDTVLENNERKSKSLDSLLKYYQQAFKEKEKLYFEKCKDNNESHGIKMDDHNVNNINNTFNISVNINTPSISTLSKSNEFKLSSIEEIENMINNFSSNNMKIENCFNEVKVENKELNSNSIAHILNHLNELESLLQNTKKQLINFESSYFKGVNYECSNGDENKVDNLFRFEL
jgi:hypothetical protein